MNKYVGADLKTEPQNKEVEWVYNKRERLWYPYSNGEPLFEADKVEGGRCLMIYLRYKDLIKLIEAQKQLIEEYEKQIALLEERNGLLEKAIRDLVRIAKGVDDE